MCPQRLWAAHSSAPLAGDWKPAKPKTPPPAPPNQNAFFSFSPNFSPPNLVFSWPRHPDPYSGTEFFSPDSCWAPWPPALPAPLPPRGGGRQLYLGGPRGTLGTVDPSCSRAASPGRLPACWPMPPRAPGARGAARATGLLAARRGDLGHAASRARGPAFRVGAGWRATHLRVASLASEARWGLPRPQPTSRPRTPLREAAWGKSLASPPRGRGSGGNATAAETGVERRVPGEPPAAPGRCLAAPAPTQPADTRPAPLGPAAWAPTCHDPYPGPGPG